MGDPLRPRHRNACSLVPSNIFHLNELSEIIYSRKKGDVVKIVAARFLKFQQRHP